MKHGEGDLDNRAARCVKLDRDPAAVVLDGDAVVGVNRDGEAMSAPGEVLVNGVGDELQDKVVEPGAIVDIADVHARPLADRRDAVESLGG